MRITVEKLKVPPSLEVTAVAQSIGRLVSCGTMSSALEQHKERLIVIALELSQLADDMSAYEYDTALASSKAKKRRWWQVPFYLG